MEGYDVNGPTTTLWELDLDTYQWYNKTPSGMSILIGIILVVCGVLNLFIMVDIVMCVGDTKQL